MDLMLRKTPAQDGGRQAEVREIFDQHVSISGKTGRRKRIAMFLALAVFATVYVVLREGARGSQGDISFEAEEEAMMGVKSLRGSNNNNARQAPPPRAQEKSKKNRLQKTQPTPDVLRQRQQRMEPERRKKKIKHPDQPLPKKFDEDSFAKDFMKKVKVESKGERKEWGAKTGIGRKEKIHV